MATHFVDNRIRFSSYVFLFAGLSVASVLGVIGLLNNVYADNTNMTDNMNMNSTVNTNMTGTMTGNMTGTMNETMTTPSIPKMMSPLEQFKSGTAATSVKCSEGLTLVIKIEDGSPACVSSQISQELVARGWGTTS